MSPDDDRASDKYGGAVGEPLQLHVELEVDGHAIRGSAVDARGCHSRFEGWLELIALVEQARTDGREDYGRSGPADHEAVRKSARDGNFDERKEGYEQL